MDAQSLADCLKLRETEHPNLRKPCFKFLDNIFLLHKKWPKSGLKLKVTATELVSCIKTRYYLRFCLSFVRKFDTGLLLKGGLKLEGKEKWADCFIFCSLNTNY